jgi:hypothetical protein
MTFSTLFYTANPNQILPRFVEILMSVMLSPYLSGRSIWLYDDYEILHFAALRSE